MKIFILSILICGVFSINLGETKNIEIENAFKEVLPFILKSELSFQLTKDVGRFFIPLVLDSFGKVGDMTGRIPVIPTLPDPIMPPDANHTIYIADELNGELAIWNNVISGLSTLKDSLEVKIVCEPNFGLKLAFAMDLPTFLNIGDYELDFKVLEDTAKGRGDFRLGLTDFSLGLALVVTPHPESSDKLLIGGLDLDISFGTTDLFFENFELFGTPIPNDIWEEFSQSFPETWRELWPSLKGIVQDLLTGALNDLIKDCSIMDFIEFILGVGDLSCLNPSFSIEATKTNFHDRRPAAIDLDKSVYKELIPLIITRAEESGLPQYYARSFLVTVFEKIRKSPSQAVLPGAGRIPFLPNFEDPLYLGDGTFPFNLLELLQGNVSISDGVIEGLSTIDDDLAFKLSFTPFGLVLNLTLAKNDKPVSALFQANHSSEIDIVLPPINPIQTIRSNGEIKLGVNNAKFNLGMHLGLRPGSVTKLQVSQLTMNLSFRELVLFVENIFFGGCYEVPMYWKAVEDFIKWFIDTSLADETTNSAILDFVTKTLDDIIHDCTIVELVGIIFGGDASCLYFPGEPTTTTTLRTTTTTISTPRPTTTRGTTVSEQTSSTDPTSTSRPTVPESTEAQTTTPNESTIPTDPSNKPTELTQSTEKSSETTTRVAETESTSPSGDDNSGVVILKSLFLQMISFYTLFYFT